MPFDTRDVLTLTISTAALVLSSISYFQKRAESTQSLRKRLTDVMKELSELSLKDSTFRSLEKKDGYPRNYLGLLADQRRFFVREAATLADGLGKLVSPHEKALIATTFDSIDFVEDADRFFKSAAISGGQPIDTGLAWRNYGRFLYRQGQFQQAEAAYENALLAFRGGDDRSRFYRSGTYIRWAEAEFDERNQTTVIRALVEKARVEAAGLQNDRRKDQELERIAGVAMKLGISASPAVVAGAGE